MRALTGISGMIRPALIWAVLFAPSILPAPAYIKLGDIKGESTDKDHKDWIIIESLHSGIFKDPAGEPGTPADFGEFQIIKPVDASTPLLMQACADGTTLPGAELPVTKQTYAGNQTYFKYKLKDVIVTSIQTGGSDDAGLSESVTLKYSAVDCFYWQIQADGTIVYHAEATWDLLLDQGSSSEGAGSGGENQPPTLQPIGAQTVLPGEHRMVVVLIGDDEILAENLIASASTTRPDLIKNLVITGSGAERNLSFSASPLYSGSGSVTVEVSDGSLKRSVSFAVLIDVEMTPFEAFLAAYFSPEELLDLDLSSPIGDPDEDNMATVMEFALGTNPREYTYPQEAVKVTRLNTLEGPAVQLDFNRHKDAGKLGPVPWMAPESFQYKAYTNDNPLYKENTKEGVNPLYEAVSATILLNKAEADVHFIRMAVELD